MAHGRVKLHGPERANSANPEDNFLPNARFLIAAVKLTGNGAVVRMILWDIAIEEVKRNSADLNSPDLGPHPAAGQRNVHDERLTVFVEHRVERQIEKVIFRVTLLLPAVHVKVLAKISFAEHDA